MAARCVDAAAVVEEGDEEVVEDDVALLFEKGVFVGVGEVVEGHSNG